MSRSEEFRCSIDDPKAEGVFRRFAELICGDSGHARHAVLIRAVDGLRCMLQNSGRCIESGTPWAMVRETMTPLFRFDQRVEQVILVPVDDWQMRLDAALRATLDGTDARPWAHSVAEDLAAELDRTHRLVICR